MPGPNFQVMIFKTFEDVGGCDVWQAGWYSQ